MNPESWTQLDGSLQYLAATSFKCAAIVGIDRPGASEEISSRGHPARGHPARGQVPGINAPSASEIYQTSPGRLSFSQHFCYFSCDLYGIEIFRIFAG